METIKLSRDALRSKVDNCIQKYLSLSPNQSLSIGLYIKGKKYVIDFGNDENTLFYDIGSITKTITAHLLLKIFQEGGLDLHLPVSRFIPLKEGRYPTIYQLLTHTAGYRHITPVEITLPHFVRYRYPHRNLYEGVAREQVVTALGRRRRNKGKYSYRYSDFSYAVLAVVLERITKQPFNRLLTEFLRETLDMRDTTIVRQTTSPSAVHRGKIIPYWRWEKENPYIAAGGLVSTLTDMLKYLELQMQTGEDFITKAHEICPHSFKNNKDIGTCIGWHTYKKSNRLWHVGGAGTFRSSLLLNKKLQIGVVVLGNTKGVKSANVQYLAKMLYNELKINKVHI